MISALGSSRRTWASTRSPDSPPRGLTTTTRPAPSGRGGVSMRSGSARQTVSTIGGTRRPPNTAMDAPIPKPRQRITGIVRRRCDAR